MSALPPHDQEKCDNQNHPDPKQAAWGCICMCHYCYLDAPNGSEHPPLEGTTTMSSINLRSAEQRIANAERELARARRALEEAQRPSIPPEPNCPYITFAVQHNDGGRRYAYAAININGRWYLTGQETRAFRWSALVEWMRDKTWVSPVDTLSEHGTPLEVTA